MTTNYMRVKDAPVGNPTARAAGGSGVLAFGTSGTFVTRQWDTEADYPFLGKDNTSSLSMVLTEDSTVNVNLNVYFTGMTFPAAHESFVIRAIEAGGAELHNDFGGPVSCETRSNRLGIVSLSTKMNLSAGAWTLFVAAHLSGEAIGVTYSFSALVFAETGTDDYSFTPVLRDFGSNLGDGVHEVGLPENIEAGDGVLIFMAATDGGTWVPPAGYSVLFGPTYIGSAASTASSQSVVSLIYKVAGANEPNPTWTNDTFPSASFAILVFRGGPASITNVVTKTTAAVGVGANESVFPNITTGANSIVVYGYCNDDPNPPSTLILNDEVRSDRSLKYGVEIQFQPDVAMWYRVEPTAGAVPTSELPNLLWFSNDTSNMFQYCVEIS